MVKKPLSASKRNPLRTVAAILLFLAAPVPLRAATLSVTMKDAIQYALDHNFELRQTTVQIAAADIDTARSKAAFQPTVSAGLQGSGRISRSRDQFTGELDTKSTRSLSLSASSNMDIFSGFSRKSTLNRSRLNRDATETGAIRIEESVIYDTADYFLQTLTATALITVEQENLASQRQQLDLVEAFVQAGRRPTADLLQQRAEVANAELQLLEAERTAHTVMNQLMVIMGAPAGIEL
ncbi:TolC family protein, partial [bacterium]|nr:TolC family protein [candidate division CSSED10-310 bacterium]